MKTILLIFLLLIAQTLIVVSHEHHDHHHHQEQHNKHHTIHTKTRDETRFDPFIWAEALFATALVGAAPVLILTIIPLGVGSLNEQKPMLRVFLSFAAGGLLGDSLLHLLPHSLPSHRHDHGHGHEHHGHDHNHEHSHSHSEGHHHTIADMAPWLWALTGLVCFLMLEKFVRAHTGGHGHSHSHFHESPSNEIETTTTAREERLASLRSRKQSSSDKDSSKMQEGKNEEEKCRDGIAPAAYLNLAADFSHNFTDGLAIGATFIQGSGWATTVAMMLHEIPHEIGDFAILLQSGFTRGEAMKAQFSTAIGAMCGAVCGLFLEGLEGSAAWITPFTAGGFIYIACTSVFPELLEDCSIMQSIKEGIAMCLGIFLMLLIALYE